VPLVPLEQLAERSPVAVLHGDDEPRHLVFVVVLKQSVHHKYFSRMWTAGQAVDKH
jgi:hypothetical protein